MRDVTKSQNQNSFIVLNRLILLIPLIPLIPLIYDKTQEI